jgi:hypothetical protein
MSDTRIRSRNVAVDDTASLHYDQATMTGTVTMVVRHTSGPRMGRVAKIQLRPANASRSIMWFVPARDGDHWNSVGGYVTATF